MQRNTVVGEEAKPNTYVALTSSFGGAGGIEDAMVRGCVACTDALFEGDFFRLKSFIFGAGGRGRLELGVTQTVQVSWPSGGCRCTINQAGRARETKG